MGKKPANQIATPEHVDQATRERGWFQQPLQIIEGVMWGRWPFWIATRLNGRLGTRHDPQWCIPQLPFTGNPSGRTRSPLLPPHMVEHVGSGEEAVAMWKRALDRCFHAGDTPQDIFDWWLWAFGDPSIEERPRLQPESTVALYSGVDLSKMLAHPTDWSCKALIQYHDGGKAGTAWFPTPIELVKAMAMMTFDEKVDNRAKTVNDPCVGTGVMLLCASNYSLRLSGIDIDRVQASACKFNGWLFMPWLVQPAEWIFRERDDEAEGWVPLTCAEPLPTQVAAGA